MAHIAVFSWYPPSKAAEVTAVFNKGQQNISPIFQKSNGPYTWATRDGVETFAAYEVANNKLYEAFIELHAALAQYAGIEGYRYDIRSVGGSGDAEPLQKAISRRQSK